MVSPRIIPARAGFTIGLRTSFLFLRDHPRSRGVYAQVHVSDEHFLGSSPLARGLRVRHPSHSRVLGIIPARAGFTKKPRTNDCAVVDHPRSRGVYKKSSQNGVPGQGSSPLARGLRIQGLTEAQRARIIPARAGFTARP